VEILDIVNVGTMAFYDQDPDMAERVCKALLPAMEAALCHDSGKDFALP